MTSRSISGRCARTTYESVLEAVSFFADDSLLFAPDSGQRYSSSNYNLLAAVVQLTLLMDWFGDTDDQGRAYIFASGANAGLQAALAVYPEQRVAAAVLSNTWGKGSRSGDMVRLPTVLAEACITVK